MKLAYAAWALLTYAQFSACVGRSALPKAAIPNDSTAVRIILREAMAQAAPRLRTSIHAADLNRIRLRREPSRAFPGVTYHWGALAPQARGLHLMTAVVAEVSDTLIVLEKPSDYRSLLQVIDREPREDAAPAQVCEEAIRTTSPGRDFTWPPRMFSLGSSLSEFSLRGPPLPPGLIQPPVIELGAGTARVGAWFFESGRTVRYSCAYQYAASTIDYTAEQVVQGSGLPRLDH